MGCGVVEEENLLETLRLNKSESQAHLLYFVHHGLGVHLSALGKQLPVNRSMGADPKAPKVLLAVNISLNEGPQTRCWLCTGKCVVASTLQACPGIPDVTLVITAERVATMKDVMQDWRRHFVLFADWLHALPEFASLSVDDQILIAKSRFGPFYWWMCANWTNEACCDGVCYANGTYFPRSEALQCFPDVRGCCERMVVTLSDPLRELQLDETEKCLMLAVIVFSDDIVPSISSISRADSFIDSNHERCLETFERRYPIMFALELEVSDEVAFLDRNGNNVPKIEKDTSKKNGTSANGQYGASDIDATDRGKLEKRIQQHHLCSRPFLRYFAASKRVVRISVPEAATNVISTVASIMLDFGFTEQRKPGRVVLFGTVAECVNINIYSDWAAAVAAPTGYPGRVMWIRGTSEARGAGGLHLNAS
ncbi:unnamed protein product [Heligmosomoides polygyrus]|uniref:NR LBD domain-containing protein n=1 Tax=Heligmosomoides polygyrus TaxID=6339 RepID=A0A3P7ZLR2_HELPZ|nr:unnamed protein product [Heligmosomoides polygyrus]